MLKKSFFCTKKREMAFHAESQQTAEVVNSFGRDKTIVTTVENTLVCFFFQPTRPVNVSEVSAHLNMSGRIPDTICRRLRQR